MAAICPTVVEGDRIRLTRVDGCGRPVYGPCNSVITDGIVSITLTPEVEEGQERNLRNFAGRQCLARAGCDTVKWWTVEIVWCSINFAAFGMINPTYRIRRNDEGDPIGVYVSNKVDCSTGYAVEIWAQVDGAGDACTGEEAQGQWVYFPVPWIAGGTPGPIAIGGEDSVTFTTTGRTRNGAKWGRGPYDVELIDGRPSPLGEALDPEEPFGYIVTTLAPPEMDCQCQDVPRPVPDPADLVVEGLTTEEPRNTVRLRPDNHGLGPVTVDWGDETPVQEVADLRTVEHKYTTPGEKTIKVCDKQDTAVCTEKKVTIPLPSDNPKVEVTGAGTTEFPNRVSAKVTLPGQSTGKALVNWGDGTPEQEVTVGEDGTVSTVHDYRNPGRYTVTVKRADKSAYRDREVITVPMTTENKPAAPKA
ncbi:hypothetical protein [Streptomyces yaizuensis]|uniref:PKD domain-containing protein n=1 Tax=Streptomyces yaizuensis TaxID=2989713 RepID=A0AA86IVE6_9ACTN|nr:hypothetical protein [Streptomyces sp. YSPA8]BDT39524.1 hypothetical protein SYYSPA8_37030 [Streptomyces sp. YSPA8]